MHEYSHLETLHDRKRKCIKGFDDSLSRARYSQDVNSNGAKWCNATLGNGGDGGGGGGGSDGGGGGGSSQDSAIMSSSLPTVIWALIS